MKKVIFQTLGCKVNQYETQGMKEKLLGSGFVETANAQDADLFILNTCTVTGEGDKKSRYLIRRMHRSNPNIKIIVTGCYAEKNRDEIVQLDGVTEVLGQNEKDRILNLALKCFDISAADFNLCRGQDDAAFSPRKRFADFAISDFQGNGRAFVKIQDGCNHACSFCKVVIVRGRSRSREIQSIIDEVKRLIRAGFKEAVLTGIQLGAYGNDLKPELPLHILAEQLLEISGLERLRLSSIEPTDVSEDLIALMESSPKFCPHLHIPLQSGDDEVLKGMRRRYDRVFYRDLAVKLNSRIRNFALTCDVMCGFPGETENQFQNTVDLLAELRPLKIHAFPYSRREGTLASRFGNDVPKPIIESRIERLIREGSRWQQDFLSAYLGRVMPVLVEEEIESNKNGLKKFRGRTGNYILAEFEGAGNFLGDFADIKFQRIISDRILGTL